MIKSAHFKKLFELYSRKTRTCLEKQSQGFTLIEVILVVSMMGIILSLSLPNLFNPLSSEKVNSFANDTVGLIQEAQNQAINGETLGQGSAGFYGVHFANGSITVFKGSTFTSGDANNFSEAVPQEVAVTTTLPCPSSPSNCNNIVFSPLTGEVSGFDNTKNKICIKDSSGTNATLITFNSLGVTDVANTTC